MNGAMDWEKGFEHLLHPMDVEYFFERHWEPQRPAYIPGTPEKFRGLFHRAAFEHALHNVPSNHSLHVRATYRKSDDEQAEVGCVGAEEAFEHFAAGATLCATQIDIADANLARLRETLRRQLRVTDSLVFNCYYSPDGQGFGMHYDSQGRWIIQLEGVKVWQYSAVPAYPEPTRGGGPQHAGHTVQPDNERVASPEECTILEVSLSPGDVLYLPGGTWHRASARGSSLALALSQPHMGPYVVVDKLLRKLLRGREWRTHLPRLANGFPQLAGQLGSRLAELKSLVDGITLADVCDSWYETSFPERPQALGDSGVKDDADMLRRAPDAQMLWLESNGAIRVYFQGGKYSVPRSAAPLLHSIEFDEVVSVSRAVDSSWMSAQKAREVLGQFLKIGLLTRAE